MPATVVVGAQWGDEGKGKTVDLLAPEVNYVVRYQGGSNAGHTVVAAGRTLKLHLVPSGILYPHITPVIGNGVVVDPEVLLEEIRSLESQGISCAKLKVSGNAHLTMPYHKALDAVVERYLGRSKLGTTKRGIGPTYADKAARIGLRVQDLLDFKIFKEKLALVLKEKNQILTRVYGRLPLDMGAILAEYEGYARALEPYIDDTSLLLHEALLRGETVLLEGAQGSLLDLDHGTYPFVTSSNPVAGSAATGAGIGPKHIKRVIGVAKAYVTRVGSGPFPTEERGPEGDLMVELGAEYGTTTGRRRRCGWFDAVIVRYAARLNTLDELFLMKLDVLSRFERIKVAVAYEYEGKTYEEFPPHQTIFHKCTPVYEELPGWNRPLEGVRRFEDLPAEARRYVRFIEEATGVPVSLVSVGPSREETVARAA